MAKAKSKIEIRNKKASFEYEFLENYTAGIVLTGTEIKSIRAGKASLVDSYCYFSGGELYVKNMHIAEYWWGTFNRHDPKRDRKLLLTKKELRKLARSVKEKGLTIVTRRLFIRLRQAGHRPGAGQERVRQAAVHQGKGPAPLLPRVNRPSGHKYTSEKPPHLRWVPSLFGSQSFRRYTYIRTGLYRRWLFTSTLYG